MNIEKESHREKERHEALNLFQEEIGARKEEEAEEKTTLHLQEIDPSELTESDRRVYERVKAGTVTIDDLKELEQEFYDKTGELADVPESRKKFIGFLRNKATPVIGRRQLDEMNKEGRRSNESS